MRNICLTLGFMIMAGMLPVVAQNGATIFRSNTPKLSAAWNPVDNRIAFGDSHGQVWIFDAIADTMIKTLAAPTGRIFSIQWRPGRNEVVYAGDSSINIWNLSTDSILTFSGNDFPVHSVSCSPDGMKVACACGDAGRKSFRIWDIAQARQLLAFDSAYEGGACSQDYVLWLPNGYELLGDGGCGWDGTIFSTAIGDPVVHLDTWFDNHSIGSMIRSASFSPGDSELAVGCLSEMINIYDTQTWHIKRQVFQSGLGIKNVLAWSPLGELLVDGDADGRISVWNAGTMTQISAFRGHSREITAVVWSPDGGHLITSSLDGSVKIWEADMILSSVPVAVRNAFGISVSPIPASGMLHVRIEAPHAEPVAISLVEMNGRMAVDTERDVQAGAQQVELDVAGIPSGAYILMVRHSNGGTERRIVQVAH